MAPRGLPQSFMNGLVSQAQTPRKLTHTPELPVSTITPTLQPAPYRRTPVVDEARMLKGDLSFEDWHGGLSSIQQWLVENRWELLALGLSLGLLSRGQVKEAATVAPFPQLGQQLAARVAKSGASQALNRIFDTGVLKPIALNLRRKLSSDQQAIARELAKNVYRAVLAKGVEGLLAPDPLMVEMVQSEPVAETGEEQRARLKVGPKEAEGEAEEALADSIDAIRDPRPDPLAVEIDGINTMQTREERLRHNWFLMDPNPLKALDGMQKDYDKWKTAHDQATERTKRWYRDEKAQGREWPGKLEAFLERQDEEISFRNFSDLLMRQKLRKSFSEGLRSGKYNTDGTLGYEYNKNYRASQDHLKDVKQDLQSFLRDIGLGEDEDIGENIRYLDSIKAGELSEEIANDPELGGGTIPPEYREKLGKTDEEIIFEDQLARDIDKLIPRGATGEGPTQGVEKYLQPYLPGDLPPSWEHPEVGPDRPEDMMTEQAMRAEQKNDALWDEWLRLDTHPNLRLYIKRMSGPAGLIRRGLGTALGMGSIGRLLYKFMRPEEEKNQSQEQR